jgi:hypothetical protein
VVSALKIQMPKDHVAVEKALMSRFPSPTLVFETSP